MTKELPVNGRDGNRNKNGHSSSNRSVQFTKVESIVLEVPPGYRTGLESRRILIRVPLESEYRTLRITLVPTGGGVICQVFELIELSNFSLNAVIHSERSVNCRAALTFGSFSAKILDGTTMYE